MKSLKCKSCGASLKVDENSNIATCPYCDSKYELDSDKKNVTININVDKQIDDIIDNPLLKHNKKIIFSIFIFALIIIISISIFMISSIFSTRNTIDVKQFNGTIELFKGTQSNFLVKRMLDEVSTSNKKNNKIITVIYNDKKITNADEIINLKSSLQNTNYEIILDYDKDGYIYQVRIN